MVGSRDGTQYLLRVRRLSSSTTRGVVGSNITSNSTDLASRTTVNMRARAYVCCVAHDTTRLAFLIFVKGAWRAEAERLIDLPTDFGETVAPIVSGESRYFPCTQADECRVRRPRETSPTNRPRILPHKTPLSTT